jgi:hypothetical protein
MTPIPIEVINKMKSDTPKDYEHHSTGFSVTTASAMGQFLDVSFTPLSSGRFPLIFHPNRHRTTNGTRP